MRYQDNILYLYYDELVPELLSESNYKKLKANETITVIGRGGNRGGGGGAGGRDRGGSRL